MPQAFFLFNGVTILGWMIVLNIRLPAQELPGQARPAAGELLLREFTPQSMLVTPQHYLQRARFPVVDVHTHFGFRFRNNPDLLDQFVRVMDQHNIAVCVSLDARLGDGLIEHRDYLWSRYRNRFVWFVHIDWQGKGQADRPETWDCHQPGFGRQVAEQLAEAHRAGASGLKILKQFGLGYRNPDGSFIRIDDPRWDPIWQACGELKIPVLIHTADPAAFFEPVDARNERWEELYRHPEWSFADPQYPRRPELLAALLRVVERHRATIFIAAHLANYGEDLATLGTWLDQHPNLYVDIASRINELGRQPYSARRFLIRYADRVLFATDGPWPPERLTCYWRFLETEDEYFPYSERPFPPQGFWHIYGVFLPDAVLRKIYYENAARLIPGVKERLPETCR